jgi:hypothetical protein
MRVRHLLSLVTLLFALPSPSAAQAPAPPAVLHEVMDRIAFLAGSWQGVGSFAMGPGREQPMTSAEEVARALDGLLLTIEGRHFARFPSQDHDTMVHHAFAVISPREDGTYRVHAFLADGQFIETEGRLTGDTFVWGFEHPRQGQVRYHIRLSEEGQWVETGERSVDGESWTPYLSLTLDREAE